MGKSMVLAYILMGHLMRIWLEKERTETFEYFMNEGRVR